MSERVVEMIEALQSKMTGAIRSCYESDDCGDVVGTNEVDDWVDDCSTILAAAREQEQELAAMKEPKMREEETFFCESCEKRRPIEQEVFQEDCSLCKECISALSKNPTGCKHPTSFLVRFDGDPDISHIGGTGDLLCACCAIKQHSADLREIAEMAIGRTDEAYLKASRGAVSPAMRASMLPDSIVREFREKQQKAEVKAQ